MAASDVTQTVLFCRALLIDLGLFPQGPSPILTDSKSAIAIAADPVAHKRTKHINIRYHFIRDHIISRRVDLRWIPGGDNLADLMTKPVSVKTFSKLIQSFMGHSSKS